MENIFKNKYKITLFLVIWAGIIIRTILYIQNPSLWGDEAGLALNTVNKSFSGLFGELDNLQACPIGFLIVSKILLKVLSPDNMFYRDLILRFLPFISGIAAIFAFWYFANLLFKSDKAKILISVSMVSLLPLPVIYSAQYKQYSTELLISIVLLTVFYKLINTEQKNLLLSSFIIALSLWFSYSSVFIITSGFLALFIKNKKTAIKAAILPFFSALIIFIINMKAVFNSTYHNMTDSLINSCAFLSPFHPLRIFMRMGEIFAPDTFLYSKKLILVLAGVLTIYFVIRYFFSKENLCNKILFYLPIILVLTASFLHIYPLCARLMLFLLPLIIIYIVSSTIKYDNIVKLVLLATIIISATSYNYHIKYSYARDIVPILQNKLQNADNFIYDYPNNEYRYYAKNPAMVKSKPQIPAACATETLDFCREYMNNLPKGEYYFLSHNYYVKQVLDDENKFRIIDDINLGYIPKETKVVHFEVR